MNLSTLWSTRMQSPELLYETRSMRFADVFKENYTKVFSMDDRKKILEIGCGPGALAESLSRWYPEAEITGLDRNTNFIEYAKDRNQVIKYIEGDAAAIPLEDDTYDVTISNTVQEHIHPDAFWGEQYRVLRDGGICVVLSARKGIWQMAPCIREETELEKRIWERVKDTCMAIDKQYNVGAYGLSEMELPKKMESYGFKNVTTEYLTVNLTPDHPRFSKEMAHRIINSWRATAISGVVTMKNTAGDRITNEEYKELLRIHNRKYDERIALYDAGVKLWDTAMSVTMVLRGEK